MFSSTVEDYCPYFEQHINLWSSANPDSQGRRTTSMAISSCARKPMLRIRFLTASQGSMLPAASPSLFFTYWCYLAAQSIGWEPSVCASCMRLHFVTCTIPLQRVKVHFKKPGSIHEFPDPINDVDAAFKTMPHFSVLHPLLQHAKGDKMASQVSSLVLSLSWAMKSLEHHFPQNNRFGDPSTILSMLNTGSKAWEHIVKSKLIIFKLRMEVCVYEYSILQSNSNVVETNFKVLPSRISPACQAGLTRENEKDHISHIILWLQRKYIGDLQGPEITAMISCRNSLTRYMIQWVKNCPNVCAFWKDWHGEK